ncbi:MAG: hypothetical protein GKR87_04605 [Kiritimatiellae bacterium]|nr:hypothetical protein [Kiritimatiellia bacterium]
MLEWYRTDADYLDILEDTKSLFRYTAQQISGTAQLSYQGYRVDLDSDWYQASLSKIYKQYAGWDPVQQFDADRFDLDLVEKIQPSLPKNRRV